MGSTAYSSSETWSNAAGHYAAQMALATSQATERLINLTNSKLPFDATTSLILDNGAGNGVLTTALTISFPGLRIVAADISPTMLATLDAKCLPHVSTLVMDACVEDDDDDDDDNHAALPPAHFSHVLSTFMTQFTDDPDAVVREAHRMLQPDGVLGLGSWLDIGINWPWEEACRALDPAVQPRSPYSDTAWTAEEDVDTSLRAAGFREIVHERVRLYLRFGDTEEYVGYWYSAKNPGMLRMQSAWGGDIEEVRATLDRILREKYAGGKEFPMMALLTSARK